MTSLAGTLPILMYHAVPARAADCRTPLDIPLECFADQLDALTAGGWTVTGLSDAVRLVSAGEQRVVALTLDDAYADLVEVTGQLRRRGMSATVYVPTDFPDAPARSEIFAHPTLSWAGLKDLAAEGIELGSHSRSHRPLDVLPRPRLHDELAGSRDLLAERTGVAARSVCYPYGYASRSVDALARQAGYENGCTVGRRVARAGDSLLRLPRLQPLPTMSTAEVVRLLTDGEPGWGPKVKPLVHPAWRVVRFAAARSGRTLT